MALVGVIVVGGLLAGVAHNLTGFWAGFGVATITIIAAILISEPLHEHSPRRRR